MCSDFDLALAFDKAPIGVFILKLEDKKTKEFRNVYVNQTNSEIVGVDLQPFMGKLLRDTFPDSYTHGLPDKYIQALETNEKVRIGEVEYGDKVVEKQVFFLEAIPLNQTYVMLTTENVTALRKAKEDLVENIKQLNSVNAELKDLTHVVSHDLKGPIRNIRFVIELLCENCKDSIAGEDFKALQLVSESAKRMQCLVEDILDFATIGQKKEREMVDCNELVEDVLTDLRVTIKNNNAEICYQPLPSINGYKTELRQLFQNLIGNAIKFQEKGVAPVVSISAELIDGYHHFTISDNGIGINPKDKDRIFAMFERTHIGPEYKGSGIGLTTCKKVVELHDGTIWLDEKKSQGSMFHFTLKAS